MHQFGLLVGCQTWLVEHEPRDVLASQPWSWSPEGKKNSQIHAVWVVHHQMLGLPITGIPEPCDLSFGNFLKKKNEKEKKKKEQKL